MNITAQKGDAALKGAAAHGVCGRAWASGRGGTTAKEGAAQPCAARQVARGDFVGGILLVGGIDGDGGHPQCVRP